jgi:hypothetical protein
MKRCENILYRGILLVVDTLILLLVSMYIHRSYIIQIAPWSIRRYIVRKGGSL